MFRAVHADRGGRILVTDHPAIGFDGAHAIPFAEAIPLPTDATVVPLDREALAAERSGKPRRLGPGRLAAAALLPAGYLRLQLPAYVDATDRADLAPRPYAAIAADERGDVVVAAAQIDRDATHDRAAYARGDIAAHVGDVLRGRSGDRLLRQLARCAREYGCRGAANAFFARWDCAIPIAAPSNERAPDTIALKRDGEAEPTESAAFHPTPDEIARLATEHFASGGTMLAFGRSCEGEPLLAAREIEDALVRIRSATPKGTIHLETNGSTPGGLRRLVTAGLDSIAVRIASARASTYEAIHRPDGYRFPDVRATLRLATDLRLSLAIKVLALPGLFDRDEELAALISLASDAPEGSSLLLRDLHADPLRALALVPARGEPPLGMSSVLERLRHELPHLRIGAFVRPLAKVPDVP